MGSSFVDAVGSIATVALIVFATRWIAAAKGPLLPKTRDGTSIYGIKPQWRAVGLGGAIFSVIVSICAWHDLHRPDRVLIAFTLAFVMIGVWLSGGSVSTDSVGLTKRVLWRSRSFRWGDITEIRLHKRDGGAIELRAGSQKLIVDSRFIASQHLLAEIEDHTQLQPTRASS